MFASAGRVFHEGRDGSDWGAMRFRFRPSAFKHGCTKAEIITAWNSLVSEFYEGEDPIKIIRIGVDGNGRVLEVGAHVDPHTNEVLVFHAMTARSRYTKLCQRRKRV